VRVEVRDCAHVSRNVAFRGCVFYTRRTRQPKRGLQGLCLLRTVRSMSATFRMWLSHLDNGLSCGGSARASARHGRSVQDVSFASGRGHGSPMGMPPFEQVECLFRASVEQAASQASATVLTSTEGMGCFWLPGAVRLFACAQIGLVSQAELVLRLELVMAIRFLEVMGVLSSGLSSARTLASPGSVANSTLVDARNTIERATTQTLLPWA
jgi:hypothetical protein